MDVAIAKRKVPETRTGVDAASTAPQDAAVYRIPSQITRSFRIRSVASGNARISANTGKNTAVSD